MSLFIHGLTERPLAAFIFRKVNGVNPIMVSTIVYIETLDTDVKPWIGEVTRGKLYVSQEHGSLSLSHSRQVPGMAGRTYSRLSLLLTFDLLEFL